jgi:hypothetical protein
MSLAVKLTGIAHHEAKQIQDCIVPKNGVKIVREANAKASDGFAYRADCKGLLIGYIPELSTLRKYYSEAYSESKRHEVSAWGSAVKACREQFKIDYEMNGTESWSAKVCGLLYSKTIDGIEAWVEFEQYSDLCQAGQGEGWNLRQISVLVDGVECF